MTTGSDGVMQVGAVPDAFTAHTGINRSSLRDFPGVLAPEEVRRLPRYRLDERAEGTRARCSRRQGSTRQHKRRGDRKQSAWSSKSRRGIECDSGAFNLVSCRSRCFGSVLLGTATWLAVRRRLARSLAAPGSVDHGRFVSSTGSAGLGWIRPTRGVARMLPDGACA